MKRTRAQNPKLNDPQKDPSTVAKPQRRTKQPRQPKVGGKKTAAAAAREAAAAEVASAPAVAASGGCVASAEAEMCPSVPDVFAGAGGEESAEWDDIDGGLGGGSWWTFGVEEEKLLGWFPFVEEDFRCLGGGSGRGGDADTSAFFDDDIWRIHQIYEIPNYTAK